MWVDWMVVIFGRKKRGRAVLTDTSGAGGLLKDKRLDGYGYVTENGNGFSSVKQMTTNRNGDIIV